MRQLLTERLENPWPLRFRVARLYVGVATQTAREPKSGMVHYRVIYDELFADCLFLQIRQEAQTGLNYAPDSLFLATKRLFRTQIAKICIEQIKAEQLRCRIIAGKSGFCRT